MKRASSSAGLESASFPKALERLEHSLSTFPAFRAAWYFAMILSKSERSSDEMSRLATFGTSWSPLLSLGDALPDSPFSGGPLGGASSADPAFSAAGFCEPPQPASRPTARKDVR